MICFLLHKTGESFSSKSPFWEYKISDKLNGSRWSIKIVFNVYLLWEWSILFVVVSICNDSNSPPFFFPPSFIRFLWLQSQRESKSVLRIPGCSMDQTSCRNAFWCHHLTSGIFFILKSSGRLITDLKFNYIQMNVISWLILFSLINLYIGFLTRPASKSKMEELRLARAPGDYVQWHKLNKWR